MGFILKITFYSIPNWCFTIRKCMKLHNDNIFICKCKKIQLTHEEVIRSTNTRHTLQVSKWYSWRWWSLWAQFPVFSPAWPQPTQAARNTIARLHSLSLLLLQYITKCWMRSQNKGEDWETLKELQRKQNKCNEEYIVGSEI